MSKKRYGEDECPVLSKMRTLLRGAASRALSYDREFNLTLDDLVLLYVEICPILGIDLIWDNKGPVCHGSPSLDRINNKSGYVKGNVQIISHRANSLKRDYLLVEWEKMSEYMRHSNDEPIQITEAMFKEPLQIDERTARHIRASKRQGASISDIVLDFDLPVNVVSRYYRQID